MTPVSSLASLRPFGRNQTLFLVSLHTTTRLVARWNITTPAPVSSLSNQQMLQSSIEVTRGTKEETEGKELDRLTYHQTITRKVFVYWWIGTKTSWRRHDFFFDDLTKKIEGIFSTEFVPAFVISLRSQGRSFDQGGNISSNTWQKISVNKWQLIFRSQL